MNAILLTIFFSGVLIVFIMIIVLIYQLIQVEKLEKRIKEKNSEEETDYQPDNHFLGSVED